MSEPSRSELAEMFKASGFTSRDGTYLQGETFAVINAILALRAAKPERERVIEATLLENQTEIMGAVSILLRYAAPNLVGKAGELDRQRDDLLDRHKATQAVLRALKGDPASTVAHLPSVVVTKQEW